MKKLTLTAMMLFSLITFSQDIPEGWDTVILNGKTAYMNLVTGAVVTEKPKKPAEKPTIKIELDPSIYHKVEKGDTLKKIADKYGITLDELYSFNASIEANSLQVGQEVKVGYDKSKEGKFKVKVVEDLYTNPSNNSQHYVKKGETLFSISREHGITVDKLKKLNGLTDNLIKVGQKLKLQD